MPEPEIELDRTYTVPLSRAWIAPRYKRTARAVNVLREFAEKHMKSSEIKIDSDLNERIWNRGITKPPRRIKVRMTKDEGGLVTLSLPKEAEEEAAESPGGNAAEQKQPPIDEKVTEAGGNSSVEKKDTEETAAKKEQAPASSKRAVKKKGRAK